MSIPRKAAERIAYFRQRGPVWSTNSATLKVTTAACAALGTKVTTAADALAAQQAAQSAALSATLNLNDALAAMTRSGSDLISQIKSTAKATGDNSLYALAELAPPAPPSPVPPPGTPTDFKVTLVPSNGSLQLTWKCPKSKNATGVMYQVERKLSGAADFTLIGGSGRRELIDSTVPAGTPEVTYRITATRTTGNGTPATYAVQWGNGGAGLSTAAPVVTPRIAA